MKYLLTCLLLLSIVFGSAQNAKTSNFYSLDRGHSELNFGIKWMKSGKMTGTFHGVAGSIYYDPKKPSDLSASLKINIKTLSTGIGLRDGVLMKEWFDTAAHSFAYFESIPLTKQDKPGTIRGNFTLKGITKVITLSIEDVDPPAADYQNDPFIVITGRTYINRKEFNVTVPTSRYESSVNSMVAISDSVLIEFNLLGKQTAESNALARITQPNSRNLLVYNLVKDARVEDLPQKLDSFYRTTPATNPQQDFSAWYVGTYYLAKNDIKRAIPLLMESDKQFPSVLNNYDIIMQIYYAAGNKDEAKVWMNKMLALDPHNTNALEYKRRL